MMKSHFTIKKLFPFEIQGIPEVKGPGQLNWGAIADYSLPELKGDGKLSDLKIACKNYNSEAPYNPKLFN